MRHAQWAIIAAVLAAGWLPAHADPIASGTVLPTVFRNSRIYLAPRAPTGETIEFYTDSGGGFNAIRRGEATKLGLKESTIEDHGHAVSVVDFPSFLQAQGVPPPSSRYFADGRLVVASDDQLGDMAGFLGGRWFADKVWEFDYIAHTLKHVTAWTAPVDRTNGARLGFDVDAKGVRQMNFPRMTIRVEGEPLDVLLDTGATATLSTDASKEFHLPEGTRVGASFIITSVFKRWALEHPDWMVIAEGDVIQGHALPMIRVPELMLADQTVGPVWFAVRPDPNFTQMMSEMMDASIVGAIGGSAFQYVRMVVDYPGATAWFYKPK